MNVVAVIQARYGSEFYPGKVLHRLAGRPMLTRICERALAAQRVHEVTVAIPHGDDERLLTSIPEECSIYHAMELDENDLVSRLLLAADVCEADVVVRVCADNPCIQPQLIDQLVDFYLEQPCIFLSNTVVRVGEQLVDGLGAEVLSYSRLKWLNDKLAVDAWRYREHPHLYFHEQGFGPIGLKENAALPIMRLDVDTLGDAEFIERIYAHCYPSNPLFTIHEIIEYLREQQQNSRLAARS